MMKYRFEYNGNSDFATLHLSVKVVERYVSTYTETMDEKTSILYALINGVNGVSGRLITGTIFNPYSITVGKAQCFTVEEVLTNVLIEVVKWLQVEGLIKDGEEFIQLPTIRNDINVMQCPECQRIQDEEMKRYYEDMK